MLCFPLSILSGNGEVKKGGKIQGKSFLSILSKGLLVCSIEANPAHSRRLPAGEQKVTASTCSGHCGVSIVSVWSPALGGNYRKINAPGFQAVHK